MPRSRPVNLRAMGMKTRSYKATVISIVSKVKTVMEPAGIWNEFVKCLFIVEA